MYDKIFHETENVEVITIIGCGIAGASIAYQLSKQAKELAKPIKIRVIEQTQESQIPNRFGSSFGRARITRLATAEGEEYIPYAKRSQEIAAELEKATNRQLHIHSGGLIIGPDTNNDWPQLSANYAQKNAIHCEVKNKSQLEQYDFLKIKENEVAYFEPSMGMFVPDTCQSSLIELAKANGVEFIFGESYKNFTEKPFSTSMIIHTNNNSYPTDKLILSMGPWLQKELTKELDLDVSAQLSVHSCTMYTFKVEERAIEKYQAENCPVLIWQTSKNEAFVFFPDVDGSGTVNFALFPITDLVANSTTPEEVKASPPLESADSVFKKYIQPHFYGISSACEKVSNYPFTMNRNEKFIYDSLPNHQNVKIVDPGSGHGYKHAFAFGEQVAQHILTNKSDLNIETTFGSFFKELDRTLQTSKKIP